MRPPLQMLIFDAISPDMRALSRTFSSYGVIPHYTSSLSEALDLVKNEKLHAAAIDWRGPQGPGEALVRGIRASSSNTNIPLVLLTETPYLHEIGRAIRRGFGLLLTKPVRTEDADRTFMALCNLMNQERRKYQRVPIDAAFVCTWAGLQSEGRIVNLSARGALVELDRHPPLGETIVMSFGPDEGQSIRGTAIRYDLNGALGVRFEALSAIESRHLEDLIDGVLAY